MRTIDKLAWIEIRDRRVLATRSVGRDRWYIPGGKREAGETDLEALTREIQEELSVTIDAETVVFVGVFEAQAHGHPEGTMVKMTCYTGGYTGTLKPAAEIEEMRWLTNEDRDKISYVDVLIFDYLEREGLI